MSHDFPDALPSGNTDFPEGVMLSSPAVSVQAEAEPFEGVILLQGKSYMMDGAGRLVPLELIKDIHLLEDQTVRKIFSYAEPLSAQIARFKGHTFDDIAAFQQLLSEKYDAPIRGGRKGNLTLTSYDGLLKVDIRMSENLAFGPELEAAKALIDECINEWAADSNAALRALINRAFQVDEAGRINRNDLLRLRTINITDEKWRRAMDAITDSIRIVGTTTYQRFFKRAAIGLPWENVSINIAGVDAPKSEGEERP